LIPINTRKVMEQIAAKGEKPATGRQMRRNAGRVAGAGSGAGRTGNRAGAALSAGSGQRGTG